MKPKTLWMFVLIVIVSFFLGGLTARGQKTSGLRPAWEYKETVWPNDKALAEIGSQGWEMVTVVVDGNGDAHFYFKRVK